MHRILAAFEQRQSSDDANRLKTVIELVRKY